MKIWPENESIHPLRRVKWGIDPTASRLHLGHLASLRLLQSIAKGRELTIVIGTLTARLGDPTGVNKTRPILSESVVRQNAEAIKEQLKRVCKFEFKIVENHTIADRATMADFLLDASSKFTVEELMQREEFSGRSVGLQELLVPLAQALDSVFLETQIEVGGQDQLINFSLTRKLQKSFGQRPQTCILSPIVTGLDGRKMSKSLDNCLFLDDSSETIRQKCLNISDDVMKEWLSLVADVPNQLEHPQKRKEQLSESIIKQLNP